MINAGEILGAVIMAAMPLAPGETRAPGPYDEHAAMQAVLGLVKERNLIAEDRDDTETLRRRAVVRAMAAETRVSDLVGQVEAAEKGEREAVARAAVLRQRILEIADSGCSANLLAWPRADLIRGLSCTPRDRCSGCRCRKLLGEEDLGKKGAE